MIQATLVIHCDSEWLIAGGNSTLGTADMAPMRDAEGLPFVPGRTIRGLLREAMAIVDDALAGDRGEVQTEQTERLFGTRKQDGGAGESRDAPSASAMPCCRRRSPMHWTAPRAGTLGTSSSRFAARLWMGRADRPRRGRCARWRS